MALALDSRWLVVAMLIGWSGTLLAASPKPDFAAERKQMVNRFVVDAGVKNSRVINAMRKTPRHEFVHKPDLKAHMAYYDMALPIGHGQTISPPFIVAYMTEQLDPQPTDKVLEIGTGSGYQAAVLSGLVSEVYTIKIVEPLGRQAAKDLKRLKYRNVYPKVGDGYQGWEENAPFDKIIVTCSPEKIPPALVAQLKEGGRMIIPVGERYQQVFYLLKKENGELKTEALKPTLFVPMTGKAEEIRKVRPNSSRPAVVNGDFEEATGNPPEPTGWHYQRQLDWVEDAKAPSGKHYVTFTNTVPGRYSQAVQGFAVDGKQVKRLDVSLQVRATNVQEGQDPSQLPALVITFYDESRVPIETATIGPWRGTFDWNRKSGVVFVPLKAHEAGIHIGLLGATGELSVDSVRIDRSDEK